jgi:hypothetical protein
MPRTPGRFKKMDPRPEIVLQDELRNAASPADIEATAAAITEAHAEELARGLSAGNTAADGRDNEPVIDVASVLAVTNDEITVADADLAVAKATKVKRESGTVVYVSRDKEPATFDILLDPDEPPIRGMVLANGKLSFRVPKMLAARFERHHMVVTGRLICVE